MILVTGGASYVGSHAVAALVAAGKSVVVVDNLSTGHREAVADGVELVVGDVRDQALVAGLMQQHRVDAVMHFAAKSLVGESMQKPLDYMEHNVAGVQAILRAMVQHDVAAIVFSSTANIYGTPVRIPIDETCPARPGSPYGESKLAAERLIYWACELHGIAGTCLRYFNASGAHTGGHLGEDHDPETHLIPRVLETAMGQYDSIAIFGDDYDTPDGTCVRDYIHVDDLAAAHLLALDAEPGAFRVLNLGNERGYSVREVIAAAKQVTGIDFAVRDGDRRPGDPATLVASAEAARTTLGWTTAHSDLHTILDTAWRWHKRHPSGYANTD